jgi:hypothetical protein
MGKAKGDTSTIDIVYKIDTSTISKDFESNQADPALVGLNALANIMSDVTIEFADIILSNRIEFTPETATLFAKEICDGINFSLSCSLKDDLRLMPRLEFPEREITDLLSGRELSEEDRRSLDNFKSTLELITRETSYDSANTEKIYAFLALEVLGGKSKGEIREIFDRELQKFKDANKEIAKRDHARDGIDFVVGDRRVNLKGDDINLDKISEVTGVRLSGEQLEYILTTQYQGITGMPATKIQQMTVSTSKKYDLERGEAGMYALKNKSSPFCEIDLSTPDKVIVRSIIEGKVDTVDVDTEERVSERTNTTSIESDISLLTGESFTIGLASRFVSPQITHVVHSSSIRPLKLSKSVVCDEKETYYKSCVEYKRKSSEPLDKDFIDEINKFKLSKGYGSSSDFLRELGAEYVAKEDIRNIASEHEVDDGIVRAVCLRNLGEKDLDLKSSELLLEVSSALRDSETKSSRAPESRVMKFVKGIRRRFSRIRGNTATGELLDVESSVVSSKSRSLPSSRSSQSPTLFPASPTSEENSQKASGGGRITPKDRSAVSEHSTGKGRL